jgi:hypothetical protein
VIPAPGRGYRPRRGRPGVPRRGHPSVAGRYGYHRDELYFLRAGRELAFGYPDQPPLTPLLARAMDTLAPGSLVALRLPSALAAAVVVVLTGLLASEFGGGRGAQLLAAASMAVSAILFAVGTCCRPRRWTCWPGRR